MLHKKNYFLESGLKKNTFIKKNIDSSNINDEFPTMDNINYLHIKRANNCNKNPQTVIHLKFDLTHDFENIESFFKTSREEYFKKLYFQDKVIPITLQDYELMVKRIKSKDWSVVPVFTKNVTIDHKVPIFQNGVIHSLQIVKTERKLFIDRPLFVNT